MGRLNDPAGPEEARFLERAVRELAGPDGRIIPVRLTLFAEMLRHRDWTAATLAELGGFEGIGVMFLDETFCARRPRRRDGCTSRPPRPSSRPCCPSRRRN